MFLKCVQGVPESGARMDLVQGCVLKLAKPKGNLLHLIICGHFQAMKSEISVWIFAFSVLNFWRHFDPMSDLKCDCPI